MAGTKIDFKVADFSISVADGVKKIFCLIRKKEVAFTPEEYVRQTVLYYLLYHKKIPQSHINVEKEFRINNRKKRIDIIVFKADKPYLIVECKAPEIAVNMSTLMQTATYNQSLNAALLLLTNLNVSYVLDTATMHLLPEF